MATSNNEKRSYWLNHINQWRESGLSQSKYCGRENISFHSFSWWKTRGLKDKLKNETMNFVPAIVKAPNNENVQLQKDIHLILPNQTKLILPITMPLNNLVSLIKSVGGVS